MSKSRGVLIASGLGVPPSLALKSQPSSDPGGGSQSESPLQCSHWPLEGAAPPARREAGRARAGAEGGFGVRRRRTSFGRVRGAETGSSSFGGDGGGEGAGRRRRRRRELGSERGGRAGPEMRKCNGGGRGAGRSGWRWSLGVPEGNWEAERPWTERSGGTESWEERGDWGTGGPGDRETGGPGDRETGGPGDGEAEGGGKLKTGETEGRR